MQIESPHILISLIAAVLTCGSIFLFLYNYRKREKLKRVYQLLFTQDSRFYLAYIFLIIAFILMIWWIWKPSLEKNWPEQGKWWDIVFVLDVSKSMNTLDIPESSLSRLQESRSKIENYVQKHPQHRYSLIIFAWEALSITPLTYHTDIFLNHLSQVNYSNLTQQGSNIAQALELAYQRFTLSDTQTSKTLVMISDGGDTDDIFDSSQWQTIQTSDISSLIIGVWSHQGWPIPIWYDPFGQSVFQTYQGKTVITKINEKLLKQVAESIGWEYTNLGNFEAKLNQMTRKVSWQADKSLSNELTYILAIISSIFFLFYILFPSISRWKNLS